MNLSSFLFELQCLSTCTLGIDLSDLHSLAIKFAIRTFKTVEDAIIIYFDVPISNGLLPRRVLYGHAHQIRMSAHNKILSNYAAPFENFPL